MPWGSSTTNATSWWERRSRPQRWVLLVVAAFAFLAAIGTVEGAADPQPPGSSTNQRRAAATATPHPEPSTPAPAASPSQPSTETSGLAPIGPTQRARVVEVVDGDTIKVELGGSIVTLRYIGVDTPETVHPSRPVEWMGREASAFNRELVGGREVILERDVSETDRYGRLLRYVWLERTGGWLLVNLELVRKGFAASSAYPPDVAHQDLLRLAERHAREAGVGLWSATPVPAPASSVGAGCEPAYPDLCIPPPPPDLDCGDIAARRFAVRPPDPHSFDGDGNGIGCES